MGETGDDAFQDDVADWAKSVACYDDAVDDYKDAEGHHNLKGYFGNLNHFEVLSHYKPMSPSLDHLHYYYCCCYRWN